MKRYLAVDYDTETKEMEATILVGNRAAAFKITKDASEQYEKDCFLNFFTLLKREDFC